MLSRSQQILLKRAQREAGLSDGDYRDALQSVTVRRSSTSPALADRHLDILLAYFEAIHWRAVDAGKLQPSCSATAVFRRRGYWAAKNRSDNTSRDRYTGRNLVEDISALETQIQSAGFGPDYLAAICQNVTHGRTDDHSTHLYRAALDRTLRAKRKRTTTA